MCPSLTSFLLTLVPLNIVIPVSTYNRKEVTKNSPEYSVQNESGWLGKDAQDSARLVSICEGQLNSSFLGRCQERKPQNPATLGQDSDFKGLS